MNAESDVRKGTGLYLGTEIEEKWWKRYRKNGFFMRGNGNYWYDKEGFHFVRYGLGDTITIPAGSILCFKIGKWHSGRWCFGYPILKIVWSKDDLRLSSGFLLSKSREDVEKIVAELKSEYDIQ